MTNTLYVKAYGQYIYDPATVQMLALLTYTLPNEYNTPPAAAIAIAFTTGTENPSASPYPQFNSISSAITYYSPAQGAALMTTRNGVIGFSYYTAFDVEVIDSPILTALANISYNNLLNKPTLFDGDYNHLINKPSIPAFTAQTHIADASTSAASNASTTQVTSYNTLSGLLGIATGLNDANAAQNDLATKYNALAVMYNDLSTKFNTTQRHLETLGLQVP